MNSLADVTNESEDLETIKDYSALWPGKVKEKKKMGPDWGLKPALSVRPSEAGGVCRSRRKTR